MASLLPMLIVSLGLLAAPIGLGIAMSRSLRHEPPESPAMRSWASMWVPLCVTLPAALICLFSAQAAVAPFSAPWAASPSIAAAVFALGLSFLTSAPWSEAGRAEFWTRGLVVMILGWILFFAARADRLSIMHGQFLLSAAVFWMWAVSERPPRRPDTPGLIVDWAPGPLRPVPRSARLCLVLSPLLVLIGMLLAARSEADLLLPLAIAAGFVVAVTLASAVLIVGADFARRTALSTLILAPCLTLGAFAAALLRPAEMLAAWGGNPDASFGQIHLLGLAGLALPAILMQGVGLICLLPADSGPRRRPVTGLLLIAGALIVALFASQSAQLRAAEFVFSIIAGFLRGPVAG